MRRWAPVAHRARGAGLGGGGGGGGGGGWAPQRSSSAHHPLWRRAVGVLLGRNPGAAPAVAAHGVGQPGKPRPPFPAIAPVAAAGLEEEDLRGEPEPRQPPPPLHPERLLRPRRQGPPGDRARRGLPRLRRRRPPLRRRPLEPLLLAARLRLRGGDGRGRRRAAGGAALQHELGDRPPAGDRAGGEAGRAGTGSDRGRLLHQRRLGVGRGRLEARPPVPRRQRRAGPDEGDRARDRLPRGHPRRPLLHRRRALQAAVRSAGDRDPPRFEHQPVPLAAAGRGVDRLAPRRARGGDRR